jgi:hypothetical protein
MVIIKVMPISVKPNEEEEYFGDETGTPEFYMVHDTLLKYLGEENVWVNWDYNDFIFIIENKFEDECFDISYDYKKIIEEIYEPFAPFNFKSMKKDHLKFQIISDM